jgi:D-alanine--poly(phosphoribitol) ligase subunit 1
MQINILEYVENAQYDPDKIALVDGDRSYTFKEMKRLAKSCATHLISRLDEICRPIAVFLPKCAETVFADLGIVYSGNLYTNLDVKSPARRVSLTIDNLQPALIVTSRALALQLEQMGIEESSLLLVEEIFGASAPIDEGALASRLDRVVDTDPLCIINTSGSTGVPKGVALNHRSTIDFMDWCFDRLKLTGDERIGSLSPFFFDIYTLELNLCLAKGATMVIIPDQLAIFPAKLVEFLSTQAISFIFWVPTIMVHIAEHGLLEAFDLSAMHDVFFAGEVFPTKHLNHWRHAVPAARFVNLYGPIEITVDCTYFIVDRDLADDDSLPIGYPCRNTDILILNGNDQLCENEERGELCVRGSSLAMGYWNDPEKTAKAFTQNPLNHHYPERIYRTGDIVYRREGGEIMYVGRRDFQIKHMGYRIELPEIECRALAVDGIANACVLYQRVKKEITLFYESRENALGPAEIRKKLAETLPKYMLPTAFYHMEELPRNGNGKIDRNRLNEQLQSVVDANAYTN